MAHSGTVVATGSQPVPCRHLQTWKFIDPCRKQVLQRQQLRAGGAQGAELSDQGWDQGCAGEKLQNEVGVGDTALGALQEEQSWQQPC